MINILDIVVGGFMLYYLLKNAGGLSKTIKNFLVVLVFLIVLAIISRLILGLEFAKPVHKFLEESYIVKLSYAIVKGVYPAVETTVPQVNTFMKEKILSTPTPEVPSINKVIQQIPELNLPAGNWK